MRRTAYFLVIVASVVCIAGCSGAAGDALPIIAVDIAAASGSSASSNTAAVDALPDKTAAKQPFLARPLLQPSIFFSPDGNPCTRDVFVICACGGGGGGEAKPIRFDVDEGSEAIIGKLSLGNGAIDALFLDPAGRYVITYSWDSITIWDVSRERVVDTIKSEGGIGTPVVNHNEGLLAAADSEGRVWLWDLNNFDSDDGKLIVNLGTNEYGYSPVRTIALSPDGKLLAVADKGEQEEELYFSSEWGVVRLFDVASGRELQRLEGQMLSDAEIYEEEGEFGTGLQVFPATMRYGHAAPINWLSFSPDSRYLLSGDSGSEAWSAANNKIYGESATIRLWDVKTGEHLRCLEPGNHWNPVVSPNGRELATKSGGSIFIWDISRSEVDRRFRLPPALNPVISEIAFGPDGKKIVATTGEDQTARILNSQTGRLVGLMRQPDAVDDTDFSPDGRRILAKSGDIWIWNANHSSLRFAGAAQALVDLGLEAARQGDIDEMLAAFAEAKDLVPEDEVLLRPQVWETACRLGSLNAAVDTLFICDWALSVAKSAGYEDEQLDVYEESRKKAGLLALFEEDPDHSSLRDAVYWNRICWSSGLDGQGTYVLQECELAIKLSSTAYLPATRDSRGLARALAGDYDGAIDDFWYFVDNGTRYSVEDRQKRRDWIEALSGGENPFDEATLEALRS